MNGLGLSIIAEKSSNNGDFFSSVFFGISIMLLTKHYIKAILFVQYSNITLLLLLACGNPVNIIIACYVYKPNIMQSLIWYQKSKLTFDL